MHTEHTDEAVSAQSDTSQVGLPLRARRSLFRQRIILTLRWWFRLPIDDLKDEQLEGMRRDVDELSKAVQQIVAQLGQSQVAISSLLVRLDRYEKNIPRMRDLKCQLEKEALGLRKPNGKPDISPSVAFDGS